MKNSTKMSLLQLGLDERTIKGIDAIPDLINTIQVLIDHDARPTEIVKLIRENKSQSEEIAILRKTVALLVAKTDVSCPEFDEYNNLVEDCKNRVPKD